MNHPTKVSNLDWDEGTAPEAPTAPENLAQTGLTVRTTFDAKLQNLFRETLHERRFTALQETTHSIHAHLVDRMPFIPLWQLHEHMAVDARLQPVHLDPLRVFTHVADWKLTP